MQHSVSAGPSQVIRHSTASTAWYSGKDEQSSTALETAQRGEVDTVSGSGRAYGVSPALQEEGEGHGPRKEFFAAVGADITSAGCSPDSNSHPESDSDPESSLHGHLGVWQKLASLLFCLPFSDMD